MQPKTGVDADAIIATVINLRGLKVLLGVIAGLLVSAIVVLAAAGDGPAGPLGSSAAQDGRAAVSCDPEDARAAVPAFGAALASADIAALQPAWETDRFKWFSVAVLRRGGPGRHFVARSPRRALRYVEDRAGLPLEIRRVTRPFLDAGLINFGYRGRWKPDNANGGRPVSGKGAMTCRRHQMLVWSMAVNPRGKFHNHDR